MGTTIRTYGMTEADIRGERFKDSKKDLLNNGDLFSLTQPKMICDIHRRFLEAGADIIETNTFGATSITQSEFFVDDPREHGGRKDPEFYQKIIEDKFLATWRGRSTSSRRGSAGSGRTAWRMRRAAAVCGRSDWAADGVAVEFSRCGRCGFRVVTFDQVKTAYKQEVRALIAGGVDLLLVETIFDSLNAKAALVAIREVFDEDGLDGEGKSCR
jgi:5-methyltetrahydrofolate--homocysteine methyltransferase